MNCNSKLKKTSDVTPNFKIGKIGFEKSLKKGGSITINVDLARKIDENFDEKYAVMNSEGTFFTRPALLNFIGDNGWNYNGGGLGSYIFTQSR